MSNLQDHGDELGYFGTDESSLEYRQEKVQNVRELSGLKYSLQMAEERIAHLNTVSSLTIGDPNFTIEQQLAINKAVVGHLEAYKSVLEAAIEMTRGEGNG